MHFSAASRAIFQDRYCLPGETPETLITRVTDKYGTDKAHSQRLYGYIERNWFLPASPILSNGGTDRGLPISCFLSHLDDSREGLAEHFKESLFMSTNGGGCGGSWNSIRSIGTPTSRGSQSTGFMAYLHIWNAQMLAANQGTMRRGAYAAYQYIDHPEVEEFIHMRKMTGGDEHRKNVKLHHGLNIPDQFMSCVEMDDIWPLVDPHNKRITKWVRARKLFEQIIMMRVEKGEPYLHWIDRSNEDLHPDLKAKGLKINGSNLCSEIVLPTTSDRSAVCCLSSTNVEWFDDWSKDEYFIPDIAEFLDNVLEDYIQSAPPQLWRTVNSVLGERSIGIGTMGWHSFLQSKMIPFESPAAIGYNLKVYGHLKYEARRSNRLIFLKRGPAKDLHKDRFAHMIALAPNATTAVLADTSPSIEPFATNAYSQPTTTGSFVIKNKYLNALIGQKYGVNSDEAWSQVLQDGGSVVNLDKLDAHEKAVFKTAFEINQNAIIKQAGDRQPFIDQSQSVNLFFPSGAQKGYAMGVHMNAYKAGLKTLYYARSTNVNVGSTFKTQVQQPECVSCSG